MNFTNVQKPDCHPDTPNPTALDFLIIGAQKSATTALFRYLEPHPAIAMPAAKEAPLFTTSVDRTDVANFMAVHFSGANRHLRGKATPQYMCDPEAPARIHAHNPDIRLIAVLREPIDRAFSHYRMNRRRDTETRSFEAAMQTLLKPESLEKVRHCAPPAHGNCYESEGDFYLAWGEYGRILEGYLEYFDRSQILVIFTDELKMAPELTFDRILAFLGLAPGFRPDVLGEVIHQGGDSMIIPNRFREGLKSFTPFRLLWDRVPEARREAIRYWYEQKNVCTSTEAASLSNSTRAQLAQLFKADASKLGQLTGRSAPWI